MALKKGECFLCGAEYEVCKLCPDMIRSTPWRQICDSPRHFQIYMIVKALRGGTVKADEAKEQLERVKVTKAEIETFVPSVQETLMPLFKTVKPQNKQMKNIIGKIDKPIENTENTEKGE